MPTIISFGAFDIYIFTSTLICCSVICNAQTAMGKVHYIAFVKSQPPVYLFIPGKTLGESPPRLSSRNKGLRVLGNLNVSVGPLFFCV